MILVDLFLETGRKAQNQSNANDADAGGKGSQKGSSFFGANIVKGQPQRRKEGHAGFLQLELILLGTLLVGMGIADDLAVGKFHDPVRILPGKLRVVGHHDDQLILCHIPDQIHDLYTGCSIQCSGGLITQQDLRVVGKRSGDGYTLHLSAGKLVGLFVEMILQTHLFQHLQSTLVFFCLGYAAERHTQFHVCHDGQMRNQIIALKDKSDGIVPICVPIPVGKIRGFLPLYDELSGIIAIQSPDDIQTSGFPRTACSQNSYKLLLPECNADIIQRLCLGFPHPIGFLDVF